MAIYFVAPTSENIQTICRDCEQDLYDRLYINFSSRVPQALLFELAQGLVASNSVSKVARIFDQYADFVSLQPRLFQLNLEDSFAQLYAAGSEEAITAYIERVVDSLSSVLVTMRALPVIRACPNGAAQMAAARLHEKLRGFLFGDVGSGAGGGQQQHQQPSMNLFDQRSGLSSSGGSAAKRPLLVLVDRISDLRVPLHHTITYTALMNDILGMQANRVTVGDIGGADQQPQQQQQQPAAAIKAQKEYDLDDASDSFWNATGGLPFAKVAEAQTRFMNHWREASRQVNEKADSKEQQFGLLQTDDIALAIRSIPEMQKQKRLLDMHTNILTALLRQLQKRALDAFMQLEEEFIHNSDAKYDRRQILELLEHAGATLADKLRLLIIFSLGSTFATPAELGELQKVLTKHAAETASPEERRQLAALDYIRQYKFEQQSLQGMGGAGGLGSSGASGSGGAGGSGQHGQGLLGQLARSMYGQVKGLVSSKEVGSDGARLPFFVLCCTGVCISALLCVCVCMFAYH